MLDREIRITIPGRVAPKGSMKCIGRRGRVAHVLIEDDKSGGTKQWRDTVAGAVRRHWPADAHAAKGQPIGAEITFTLDRPKTHYGTGRNARTLKASAPRFPVSHAAGDVDKLLRLILDALQDTDVLPDDCAVVDVSARKAYVDPSDDDEDVLGYPGVVIRLYPI